MKADVHPGVRAVGEPLSRTARTIEVSHAMPARLRARLHITGSGRSAEPVVSLQGMLAFSSPRARLIFRNHPWGPDRPGDGVTREARLVPSGARLVPRWSPVHGVPGRPRLSLHVADGEGRPLGPGQDLGDCGDGVQEIEVRFVLETRVRAAVSALEWRDPDGPSIAVSGELMFPRGVFLKLLFRPPAGPADGIRASESDVQLMPSGFAMYSSEKCFDCGVPDHTWVSILFLGAGGLPIVGEQAVGYCVRG